MFLLCFCDDDELSVVPSRSRLLFAGRRETLGTRLVWVNYCYWLSSLPSRASRLSSGFSSLASRFSLVPCSLLTLGRMGSCPWKNMWRRQIRSDEMYSYLQLFHLARPQSSLTSPWWRQTYMMHYPPAAVRAPVRPLPIGYMPGASPQPHITMIMASWFRLWRG